MHPYLHALTAPDKPALINALSGEVRTYAELDRRSNQMAQCARSIGLRPRDAVAILMTNRLEYFDAVWGAQRAGLYYVCVSSRLKAEEIAYILEDSGAQLLISCDQIPENVVSEAIAMSAGVKHLRIGSDSGVYDSFDVALDAMPTDPIDDEVAGVDMLYSSGTTGFPKGIKRPIEDKPIDAHAPITDLLKGLFGASSNSIYLSPAPLYHAAALRWCLGMHHIGASVIIMEKFEAAEYLAAVERYQVTLSQVVPTMLGRMLALPEIARKAIDTSSLEAIIHAAAPCPIPVKEAMIAWLGQIVHKYYAGTESNGFVSISSEEWLAHRGSVGTTVIGEIKICDEDGTELPMGEAGTVFFAGGNTFHYHNDPEKTLKSRHPIHSDWSTLGDIGRLDDEGYLYLSDRKAFMIISGGVNIYPQETENTLITHPAVADAAVFGIPDSDFGEAVKAVVQPEVWADSTPEFAEELIAFCREKLSNIKCPKSVDFMTELPRTPTGKLFKKQLRDANWDKPTIKQSGED